MPLKAQKDYIFNKNLGGPWPLCPPGYAYVLYAHVCITNMVEFQKFVHAKIACGL